MGEQKRYMLEERCLFLLALKKEQAIDEYYRQVGGGWLFLWHFRGNINFLPQKTCIYPKNLVSLRTFLCAKALTNAKIQYYI